MSGDRKSARAGASISEALVRPARREDLPRIWELLLGLADYEKLRHEVTGSPEQLGEHLFGAHPVIEALVAERDGALVGYALYFPTYSSFRTAPTMWLEDLYVEPGERGHGTGRALMAGLARASLERGCLRIGWLVLDWNQPSIDFYDGLGGRPADGGWIEYALDAAAMRALVRRGG
jgi:GNAT superfamily N-acetyltransferase